MSGVKTAIVNLCRLVLGLVLVVSGFVKAVDPLGTQYKIHDYAEAVGLLAFAPDWLTLIASMLLCGTEFVLGAFLLFGIYRHFTTRVTLLFMAAMTLVTTWIWIANPVSDCGCFGDAINLTNGETLLKNLGLLPMAIVTALMPKRIARLISENTAWIVLNYTTLFIIIIEVWSLYDLPLFDFRPYHIGADIKKGMEMPDDAEMPQFETTFIMEKDGVQREFALEDYPDSTWEFIDSHTTIIRQGYVPPIHDFSVVDIQTGEDITSGLLERSTPTLLLVAPYLETADESNFGEIDRLYEYALDNGIDFICLTSSSTKAIEHWQDVTGAEYAFCNTDATTLKTIIRSNPGLLLMNNAKVAGKWSHNVLPSNEQLAEVVAQSRNGTVVDSSIPRKTANIMLWFVLPLILLTLADRLWAWSVWVKGHRNTILLYINKVINNKKRKQ